MALFNELDAMFPSHTYFYTVSLTDMSEALDKCARMVGENAHVVTYQNQLYLASQIELSPQITWLTAVPGNPVTESESAPE